MTTPTTSLSPIDSDVLIRRFTSSDLEEAFQLSRRAGGEDFWDWDKISHFIEQPKHFGLLVRSQVSQQLLAFLLFEDRPLDKRIYRFAVPAEQTWTASLLLDALAKWGLSKVQKSKPITIVVRERDLASQLFFRDLSFRCEQTKASYFDCPPDAGYLFVRRSYKH